MSPQKEGGNGTSHNVSHVAGGGAALDAGLELVAVKSAVVAAASALAIVGDSIIAEVGLFVGGSVADAVASLADGFALAFSSLAAAFALAFSSLAHALSFSFSSLMFVATRSSLVF